MKEGEGEGPLALSETVATEACDEFRTGTERERRRIEREGGESPSVSFFILFYLISSLFPLFFLSFTISYSSSLPLCCSHY